MHRLREPSTRLALVGLLLYQPSERFAGSVDICVAGRPLRYTRENTEAQTSSFRRPLSMG